MQRRYRNEDKDCHHHWSPRDLRLDAAEAWVLHGDEGAGAVAEAQEWQRRVDEVEARVWQVEDPESSLHSEIVRSFLCIDPHRPAAMVRRVFLRNLKCCHTDAEELWLLNKNGGRLDAARTQSSAVTLWPGHPKPLPFPLSSSAPRPAIHHWLPSSRAPPCHLFA
jgi:hypothetical protein